MQANAPDNPTLPDETGSFDAAPPKPTPHKPRRWPGIVAALLVILLLIAGATILMLTRKPVWHIYTTHGGSGATPRFQIEYPDGWEAQEVQVGKQFRGSMPKGWQSVGFTRKPLAGFAGWWSKTVLREDGDAWKQARIGFMAMPYPGTPGVNAKINLEQTRQMLIQAYARIPGMKASSRILKNSLGNALDITLIGNTPQVRRGIPVPSVNRMLYIAPTNKRLEGYLIVVNSSCSNREAAHMETVFQEMVKRIRVKP